MKPWAKPYVHGTFSGCCPAVWPVMIFCLIPKWWFQRKGSWWERVMRLTDKIILKSWGFEKKEHKRCHTPAKCQEHWNFCAFLELLRKLKKKVEANCAGFSAELFGSQSVKQKIQMLTTSSRSLTRIYQRLLKSWRHTWANGNLYRN